MVVSPFLLFFLATVFCDAAGEIVLPSGGRNELLAGPNHTTSYSAWMQSLLNWRNATRTNLHLTQSHSSQFAKDYPDTVKWWTESIVQPQVHIYDRYLYNDTSGTFTVDVYLNDVKKRYGGIDSVMLWAGYPNLGIDERNQFDLLRLADVQIVAQEFRARGIHVLIGYNPWDSATRREPYDDAVALAKNLPKLNVEGYNGDTMPAIPKLFWEATLNESKATGVPPLVAEPEGGGYGVSFGTPELGTFDWDIAGWGYMNDVQYFPSGLHAYTHVPGVDRAKWLTNDGLRLTHVCDRWNKQRSDAILLSFFNGIGYESWENIWGIWNGFNDRDAELLRRSATILRWSSKNNLTRGYAHDGWRPHHPSITQSGTNQQNVFASRFEHQNGAMLWTIVNVGKTKLCDVKWASPGVSGTMYNLYSGHIVENPYICVEERSVTALLFVSDDQEKDVLKNWNPSLMTLLNTMSTMTTHKPLSSYDSTWHFLKQELLPHGNGNGNGGIDIDSGSSENKATIEAEQVLIPRVQNYQYQAAGVEIEGDCDASKDPHGVCCTGKCNIFLNTHVTGHENCQCAFPSDGGSSGKRGVDVEFPWESLESPGWNGPRRNHNKTLDLGPFKMDKYPVTRAMYASYLQQTGYQPRDERQFLVQWTKETNGSWSYPSGTEKLPVTSISLSEARAYCKAVGKRLPQTYEWQLAAQGTDGRKYPWGNTNNQSKYPTPQHPLDATKKNQQWTGPLAVDYFNGIGDSVYGVSDLIGNVWQWTGSEFADRHTRRVIVRGSSSFVPFMNNVFPAPKMLASWYFNPAVELDKHAIWLLMKNSYDRSETTGFRCLEDVKRGSPPTPYYYR